MKNSNIPHLILLAVILFFIVGFCNGCCLFRSNPVEYTPLDSTVTVTPRFIPISETNIDGVTTPLTQEDDYLTFSDVFTDSVTGKKVEVSGVIPKPKGRKHGFGMPIDTVYFGHGTEWQDVSKYDSVRIILSIHIPKDSVKTLDTMNRVRLKPIEEKGFFDGITLVEILKGALVLVILGAVVWLLKTIGVIK